MTGIGLVGCGWVAQTKHLPAIARTKGLEVVALFDLDERAVRAARDQAPSATTHASVEALTADPSVGIVAVLSPPTLHATHAVAAFEAGKRVMCEKPLALSAADGELIYAAQRASGQLGATAFMSRALRTVRGAREAIAAGQIGEVVALRSLYTDALIDERLGSRPWRRRRAEGGGALQEKLVHHVDLWRYLTGLEIESARSERIATEREQDEAVTLTARMTGDVLASAIGLDRSATANELEVLGSRGRITIDLYRVDGLRIEGRDQVSGEPAVRVRRSIEAAARLPRVAAQALRGGEFTATYSRQWGAFRDGAPLASVEDGLRATEAIESATRELVA